jgi:hypothetical protein
VLRTTRPTSSIQRGGWYFCRKVGGREKLEELRDEKLEELRERKDFEN